MQNSKLYVASSWRNPHCEHVIFALRNEGYEVYDFHHPSSGGPKSDVTGGFEWSEIDPNWKAWSPQQWRAALDHPIAQRGFAADKAGMDWADICVLVLPAGRSAHLEAGYMSGQGKPVVTLSLEPVEPELMQLLLGPAQNLCDSMADLFGTLDYYG